jgi:hypothetical protein
MTVSRSWLGPQPLSDLFPALAKYLRCDCRGAPKLAGIAASGAYRWPYPVELSKKQAVRYKTATIGQARRNGRGYPHKLWIT